MKPEAGLEHHVERDHHPAHRADEADARRRGRRRRRGGGGSTARRAARGPGGRGAPGARRSASERDRRRRRAARTTRPASRARGPGSADTRARSRRPSPARRSERRGAASGLAGAVRGRKRRPAAIAARPSGTLTRKIARQPVPSTSRLTRRAADQRAGDRGQAHDRAEHAERLLLALVAEQLADEPEALRDHDRGHRALERAARRSAPSAMGASAHSTDAATKPPMPTSSTRRRPNDVAEPAAEQQRHRHRQRVGGGDPLEAGVGAAEVAADRRRGGLGDRRVQQVHDARPARPRKPSHTARWPGRDADPARGEVRASG